MDKFFVCLSNSYKRGGRCIAGVEVEKSGLNDWTVVFNQDGSPHWIRPVADTNFGQIPNELALTIPLMHVIRLEGADPSPVDSHVEDTRYQRMYSTRYEFPSNIDNVHSVLLGNRGRAVPKDNVGSIGYSLMLIRPTNMETFEDEEREKSRIRVRFKHKGVSYELPITDPVFLDFLEQDKSNFGPIADAYLCISLGLEFEGWHHKLVAAVINPTFDTSHTTHTQRKNSYEISYDLYRQGMQPQAIAEIRGFTVGTICTHLLRYVSEGKIDVTELVSDEKIMLIYDIAKQVGTDKLTTIKEKCPDNISYDEIRFVVAAMKSEKE